MADDDRTARIDGGERPAPARFELGSLERPIIGAPMAGGRSTPALAAAVSRAGGLGMLAAGYLKPDAFAAQLERAAELAEGRPIGANLFVPARANLAEPDWEADAAARAWEVEAFAQELAESEELPDAMFGPRPIERDELGEVDALDDDGWDGKLATVEARAAAGRPLALVSFTFGCPSREVLDRVKAAGALAAVTATDELEALRARSQGAEALVVQGAEAGGHRGTHRLAKRPNEASTLELLARIAPIAGDATIIAAGGIARRRDARAALDAGADAVQLGTSLLLADEAGTNAVHRAALADEAFTETATTRAYSGRVARSLVTAYMERHPEAPAAYPELNQLTGPLKAAAREAGDPQRLHLWAGEGFRRARAESAAQIVERMDPRR